MKYSIFLAVLLSCVFPPDAGSKTPIHAAKVDQTHKDKLGTMVSGWTVVQTSKFFGKAQIFVSNNGIRINKARDGMVILAAPPTWTVYGFKPSSKKIFITSVDKFGAVTRSLLKPAKVPDLARVEGSEREYLKTQVITFKSEPIPLEINSQHHSVGRRKQTYEVVLIAASDLKLPRQATDIISKYYGIPEVDGLPMEFFYTKDVEGDQLNLATESLRRDKVSAESLRPPSGYTQVKDIRSVNIDEGMTKLIEDFAGSLGTGK